MERLKTRGRAKLYELDGEMVTIREACEKHNKKVDVIRSRVHGLNKSLQEAIHGKVKTKTECAKLAKEKSPWQYGFRGGLT